MGTLLNGFKIFMGQFELIMGVIVLIGVHAKRPGRHELSAVILVLSLAIVHLGTQLAH